MSLNCNEIDKILSELELENAFIQDIVQPSYDALALNVYKVSEPKTIFICTAAGACRIHQTWRKVPKNTKPLRFMECLKSHIKGARIESIKQIGKERIIEVKLFKAGKIFVMNSSQAVLGRKGEEQESSDERYLLYIRLWSNAGNVLLCKENGEIIDSMYRRPAKNEITGGVFDINEIIEKAKTKAEKVWEVREFEEIAEKIRDDDKEPFNRKVDIWYNEYAQNLSREALLEQAEKWYNVRRSKMVAALERLEEKYSAFLQAERYKHQGDLVMAFGFGADLSSGYLECEDYESGNTVRLKVDAKKSVQENAGFYYEQYKKAVSGQEELKHDIEMAKKEISSLDLQYNKIKDEKNVLKIEQLLRKNTTPKQQNDKDRVGLSYEMDGWLILVGRTANENDELLRHFVKGQDMWLHTRDFAGGYVFIKARSGKTIPLDILLCAGNLAVYHSKARKNGKADLYYTQVKYLRRAKNGPKGLVLPTNEKNLSITLDNSILRKLEIENIDN